MTVLWTACSKTTATAVATVSLASALVGLTGGCAPRVTLPTLDNLTDEVATARIHQAAARRLRMVGTLKARLPGLEGVVMNATLDVAAELPSSLSVAVRSFFDTPMHMLVTDGDTVTLYDASQGTPVFRRGPVDAHAVAAVLPLPLWPHEAVEVLLAHPPAGARGRLTGVDDERGTYDVWFEPQDHAPFLVSVRANDDALLRWRQFHPDGRPLVDVEYGDIRAVGAARMPFAWTFTSHQGPTEERVALTAADVDFNGPPLDADAFRLEPPQGVEILPL